MEQPQAAQPRAEAHTENLSRIRKLIADRMVESLRVAAQLTTVVEVDVTAIDDLRRRWNAAPPETGPEKLSYLPFFARATIEALKQHSVVNASVDIDEGIVTYHDVVHLAVAVDTDRGLLVPVIRNADALTIPELAVRISKLAADVRARRMLPDDLTGGTFTITNTGSRGALWDTPIINQPQVAILGTGAVVRRPVVVRDKSKAESVEIRSMAYLGLTYDHRLVDGADAARFLGSLKERLEQGSFEHELGFEVSAG